MGFIGGVQQQEFSERFRGKDPERLLAVPIDVGKHSAAALVCDFWGEIIVSPFNFALNESGFKGLTAVLSKAQGDRGSLETRVGLEHAGHYHRNLEARLRAEGLEVALLNPAQVKENRAQNLLRSLKSDARDLGAIADLVIRGKGRINREAGAAIAAQAALVAHRRRKVKARSALKCQIHSSLDLVFPGLSGCFKNLIDSKLGRLLLREGLDPQRVKRLGEDRLRSFCLRRHVRTSRDKAHQVTEAARGALLLPEAIAKVHAGNLASDIELLDHLDKEVADTEAALAEVLASTPAAILLSLPRVAVVRASLYGAGVGEPSRFQNAAQVYRLSGLVPKLYESAGTTRTGTAISREGKVELREAILELGKALRHGNADFASYAKQLESRGKKPGVVACALGNRANRLAFAMIRDQRPFDDSLWLERTGAS